MLGVSLSFVLALGPPLQVPWKCGDVRPCTQGHNGFSHTGYSYWAWDFDFTVGEEVLAASAGTVTYMEMSQGDGGCDPMYGPYANYVIVDHGDGTSAGYTHLQANSSPLQVGDTVVPGMLIGRVGLSGYVCGDHLHFQVQESCGSSYCQSVQAEFADYGDPQQGDQIESTNCPSCTLELDGTTTIVSELDPGCFVRETSYWWSTMEGDDGHHFYTIASDADAPESTGAWRFGVAVPGEYRVEVFVPQDDADAQGAAYQIHHADGMDLVPLDQSVSKGWQELGVFSFVGGPDERVELADNTGENVDLQRHLGFDAVRFTFVPGQGDTTSGASTGGDDGSGGTASASGASGESGGASGSVSSTSGTGGGSEGGLPDTFGEQGEEEGCACTLHDASPAGWPWLLVGLAAVRRRRARTRLRA